MNPVGIHPVSSAEHMLNPTDIFVVAAHEDKAGQKEVAKAAKKAHVSPERMLYSAMINMYSVKSLVRVRSGNSLFTISALKNRIGYVQAYNGDTPENFAENMHQFILSARKMGFDFLFAMTKTPEIVSALKLAVKKIKDPDVKANLNSAKGVFIMATGKKRD